MMKVSYKELVEYKDFAKANDVYMDIRCVYSANGNEYYVDEQALHLAEVIFYARVERLSNLIDSKMNGGDKNADSKRDCY